MVTKVTGLVRDLNPGPLAPEARIIPLDQRAGQSLAGQTDYFQKKQMSPPGGLEPPTFRLTAERASRLRHGGFSDTEATLS